jgi:hypothetical protein
VGANQCFDAYPDADPTLQLKADPDPNPDPTPSFTHAGKSILCTGDPHYVPYTLLLIS